MFFPKPFPSLFCFVGTHKNLFLKTWRYKKHNFCTGHKYFHANNFQLCYWRLASAFEVNIQKQHYGKPMTQAFHNVKNLPVHFYFFCSSYTDKSVAFHCLMLKLRRISNPYQDLHYTFGLVLLVGHKSWLWRVYIFQSGNCQKPEVVIYRKCLLYGFSKPCFAVNLKVPLHCSMWPMLCYGQRYKIQYYLEQFWLQGLLPPSGTLIACYETVYCILLFSDHVKCILYILKQSNCSACIFV